MKKLILVLMVLILAGTAQAEDIGLVNPGLEDAIEFNGWTTWKGATGSYGINETEVHDGNKSAEFCANVTNWNHCAGAYQEFDVDGALISVGSMVKFKGWGKATGDSPYSVLKILYIRANTTVIGYDEVRFADDRPLPDWTYGEVTGLVPAECVKVKFEMGHWKKGCSFFDDLVAEKILGYDPWDSCDPNNMLKNHNFEHASQSGGRMVPDFWTFSTDSAPGEYDHNQITDGTAVDGNDYWMLSDSNTSPEEEGLVGYQILVGLSDINSYSFSVYLRNPNMVDEATVKIGFGYYESTGYEDFWGKNVKTVTVPADNTWYQYSHSALKWLDSGKMSVRVEVHNGVTIHVDDAVLHDLGVNMCGLAGREATEELGYFPLLPGDLNADCYVNFLDMELVAEDWLECTLIPDSCCP